MTFQPEMYTVTMTLSLIIQLVIQLMFNNQRPLRCYISEKRTRVKITPREKGETRRLAFLAWGDFHARSLFVCSTIPAEKWGLLVVYISCFVAPNSQASGNLLALHQSTRRDPGNQLNTIVRFLCYRLLAKSLNAVFSLALMTF